MLIALDVVAVQPELLTALLNKHTNSCWQILVPTSLLMPVQHAVLLQTYRGHRSGDPCIMRDDFWSPSVVFNFGRLFCYDTDSTLDYNDVDDGLVIKNAATYYGH